MFTSPARRRSTRAVIVGTAALALMGVGLAPNAAAAAAATTPVTAPPAAQGAQALTARTILDGTGHGWKGPDDLTNIGTDIYVAFQNGVPSTGGATGTPATSTIVKFTLQGSIEQTWPITGKIDGLTADPAHHRVIATVTKTATPASTRCPATAAPHPPTTPTM